LLVQIRSLPVVVSAVALAFAATASAAGSGAPLWTALGNSVTCGIAIHPVNSPPMRLLCASARIPPPKAGGAGDPGFVFLASSGKPAVARLSQDSFVGTHAVRLRSGTWSVGPIAVRCTIGANAVRCVNRSGHGFTITRSSYRSF
jgi:hypothetical protein